MKSKVKTEVRGGGLGDCRGILHTANIRWRARGTAV